MRNPFEVYHPLVGFSALLFCLLGTMFAFEPVYLVISFTGALATALLVNGWEKTKRTLCVIIVLGVLVSVCNTAFSQSGTTMFLELFNREFTLEALAYGISVSTMLGGMILWFLAYDKIMTSDVTLSLVGGFIPVVASMISQVIRLVPFYVLRCREVASARLCTTAFQKRSSFHKLTTKMDNMTILASMSLEESVMRTDVLRARGWNAHMKRSSYKRYRFSAYDATLLGFFVVLAAVNVAFIIAACTRFTYYPILASLTFSWGYLLYGLLVGMPVFLYVIERLLWR